MGKIISIKHASKDDPIFTGRYTIPNPKVSTKKPIRVNKENLKEADPFFDGVKEIKRKWIHPNRAAWLVKFFAFYFPLSQANFIKL